MVKLGEMVVGGFQVRINPHIWFPLAVGWCLCAIELKKNTVCLHGIGDTCQPV